MAYDKVKVKPRQTVAQSTSQTKDLGIVSEVPMGDWNASVQYQKLNKVRYVSTGGSGVTLLAKKQNQGVEPFVSQGWPEVWMVENYDGSAVIPNGTYPEMTVGNATNAQNDGNGQNIASQFADINEKIPSTASAENQLADEAFVNSSINNMAAFYITSNSQGDAFQTRAGLLSATTFYSGGQPRVPTQNDYAIVLADESQPVGVDGSYPTTRYSYQGGTYPDGQWDFQYVVNNTSLTQAQVNAINSGITKELVDQIGAGNVLSVNGETGAVTITPAKIGALSLSGGKLTGPLSFADTSAVSDNGAALPFYLGILSFSSGGTVVYRPATRVLDDLGGFPKSGGTISDKVNIERSSYPSLTLTETTAGYKLVFELNGDKQYFVKRRTSDNSNVFTLNIPNITGSDTLATVKGTNRYLHNVNVNTGSGLSFSFPLNLNNNTKITTASALAKILYSYGNRTAQTAYPAVGDGQGYSILGVYAPSESTLGAVNRGTTAGSSTLTNPTVTDTVTQI